MGRIFELDSATLQQYQDALDDMFDLRKKTCKLVYPGKSQNCSNCILDVIGKKSSNRYAHGGPLPFPNGSICPLCGGVGTKTVAQEEEIELAINWTPGQYTKVAGNLIRLPEGTIETKGYVGPLVRKIKNCDYMIAQTNMSPFIQYKFELFSDPVDIYNVLQNRYFHCFWKVKV